MSFQVFPFSSVCQVSFRLLPTEVISNIFRYLDADSLLNAYSTCRRWSEICLGDPILRRKIRQRITEIREQRRRVLVDPGFGVVVDRMGPTTMFNRNNQHLKKVSVARNVRIDLPGWLPKIDKQRAGGPIRRKLDNRKTPYGKLRV